MSEDNIKVFMFVRLSYSINITNQWLSGGRMWIKDTQIA